MVASARRQPDLTSLIAVVGEALAAGLGPANLLELFAAEFAKLIPLDRCDIVFDEEEHLLFLGGAITPTSTVGSPLGARQLLSDWYVIEKVMERGEAILIDDLSVLTSARRVGENALVAEGMRSYLVVPLRVQGRVVALLSCGHRAANRYTEDHLQITQGAADRIAPFLAAYYRYQNERQESELRGVLAAMDHAIASSLEPEEVFPEFARALAPLLSYDRISVIILEEDGETLTRLGAAVRPGRWKKASAEVGMYHTKDVPMLAKVIETGIPWLGYDHESDEDLGPSELHFVRKVGLRSSCVVPLRVGGRVFGALCCGSSEPRAYSPIHLSLLERIASQVAPLIQNLRIHQRERLQQQVLSAQHEFIAALNSIGNTMGSVIRPIKILGAVSPQFLKLLPQTCRLEIGVAHPNGRCFRPLLQCWPKPEDFQPLVLSERSEILGVESPVFDLLFRGECRRVDDYRADPEWQQGYSVLRSPFGQQLRAGMHVPLILNDRVIGHFACDSSQVSAYTDHDLQLARQVADQLAPFVENCLLYRREHGLRERSEALARVTGTIATDAGLREVLASLEEQSQRLIPHDHLEVVLFGDVPGNATSYSTASRFQPVPLGKDVESVILPASVSPGHDGYSSPESLSRICVTLRVGGRITGELTVSSQDEGAYSESQIEVVEKLADLLALALERELLLNKVRAAAERAAAMRGMEEGAEEERRRMAMDLHDQTLADLAALASRAENLAGEVELSLDQAKEQCADLASGLRTTLAELRHLTEELHPASLDVFGLPAAIEAALSRAAARTRSGIQPVFLDRSENIAEQMPPFHRQTIYRIVQEALNNVIAHSGASSVEVSVAKDAGALVVRVADDGRGFDPKQIRARALGLHTMRHRAALIGATIDWLSRGPDSGCVVNLRVPIDAVAGSPKGAGKPV